jgi:hypothetical protein
MPPKDYTINLPDKVALKWFNDDLAHKNVEFERINAI